MKKNDFRPMKSPVWGREADVFRPKGPSFQDERRKARRPTTDFRLTRQYFRRLKESITVLFLLYSFEHKWYPSNTFNKKVRVMRLRSVTKRQKVVNRVTPKRVMMKWEKPTSYVVHVDGELHLPLRVHRMQVRAS